MNLFLNHLLDPELFNSYPDLFIFMKTSTFEFPFKILSTILNSNYVDFLQFHRDSTPQAKLKEAFIYMFNINI